MGSAERMRHVADLITSRGCNMVVLSAMSGTTNTLVEIAEYLQKGNQPGALETLNVLQGKYNDVIAGLFGDNAEARSTATEAVGACLGYVRSLTNEDYSPESEKEILAQGELMSTALMNTYLHMCGVSSVLLPALEYMRTDAEGEPDMKYISSHLRRLMEVNPDADLYLTQGYICRNAAGHVDNLQRGGSDYTASLLGAVLGAEEIEIWTDIDGMHNNDPRYVQGTSPVSELHFEEAAELAYFGAKILHPSCVLPARLNNIPVRLLNTMEPQRPGTLIHNMPSTRTIKAVAAKDNITAIKIKSSRMLLATGFLRKVFEIFESYQTPIDMIATSEVGVSMSIDNDAHLNDIVNELKKYGTVTVDTDMCIICVVGDLDWSNVGFETLATEAMKNIPVRMISYGGSNYNISFLIRERDKKQALQNLSNNLFER